MSKRGLLPKDIHRFTSVGETQFSPAGDQVLFVRQEPCAEDNQNYTTLWLVNSEGEEQQLTFGKKFDRSPRWSPDGQQVAFVSKRGDKSQIWLLSLKGGEARPIGTEVSVNSPPIWSPDGRKIAFTAKVYSKADDWQTYAGAPENDAKRARQQSLGQTDNDVKVITSISHKFDGVGFFGDKRSQIFVVAVSDKEDSEWNCQQITSDAYNHYHPEWSADGQYLYTVAERNDTSDLDLMQDIFRIDLKDNSLTKVLAGEGQLNTLRCSPSGKRLAFIGNVKKGGSASFVDVFLINTDITEVIKHADAKNMTAELDRPAGRLPSSEVRLGSTTPCIKWCDEDNLAIIYGNQGASCIGKLNLNTQVVEVLWSDALRTASTFDINSQGEIVATIGSPEEVEEIYLIKPKAQVEIKLTSFNRWLYDEIELAKQTRFTYQGHDDWDIDGWVLTPAICAEQKSLPTVLFIHGGPHGLYGSSFMFQAQILASNGLAVAYVNPRGSQSYGFDFAQAVIDDWGGNDYQDIMLGVDYLIEQGITDPERVGVTGWSFGGYMTCWAVTQTQRFKAALAGACISNRHSFYGTSDIGYYFGEKQFGGTPWAESQKLLERSAISYSRQVETPILFMHGESDFRCPISQTEEFFTALKRQGKEAVMVRYPNEPHGFKQPRHKEDRFSRLLAWFTHYLVQ